MSDKTLHITGTVVAKADLPDELKGMADECDVLGYASVETLDRDSDVVRVKGVSLRNHRAESPIKLLAGHLRILPNGESPIVGSITTFKSTTHKALNVPALCFGAKFAPTPLGKHYKSLYESGHGPDFSIGFRPIKAEPLKDGGLDYTESELLEVSCVTVPANQMATVMRAFEETYGPHGNETVSVPAAALMKEMTATALAAIAPLFKQLEDHINTRLDDLESVIVERSEDAEQSAGHTPPPQTKSEGEPSPEQVAALFAAIKNLRK
jgi:phage head maturation protease